jgi:hypothetical protein
MKYSILKNDTIDFFGIKLYATVLEEDFSFPASKEKKLFKKGTRGPYISKNVELLGNFWGDDKSRIVFDNYFSIDPILSFVDNKVKDEVGLETVSTPGLPSFRSLCIGDVYIENTWLINCRIDAGKNKVSYIDNSIICESNISSSRLFVIDSLISFSDIVNKDLIRKNSDITPLLKIEKSCLRNLEFTFSIKNKKYGISFVDFKTYGVCMYSELPMSIYQSRMLDTVVLTPDDFSVKKYIFENVFINNADIANSKLSSSGGLFYICSAKIKNSKIAANIAFTKVTAENYLYSTTTEGRTINVSGDTLAMSEMELSSKNNIYAYSYSAICAEGGASVCHALSLPDKIVFDDGDPLLENVNCSKDLVQYVLSTIKAAFEDVDSNILYTIKKIDHINKNFDKFIDNNINSIVSIFGETDAAREEIARSLCFDLISMSSDKKIMEEMSLKDVFNVKTKAIIKDCYVCSYSTIKLMYPSVQNRQSVLSAIDKTNLFVIN